MPGCHCWNVRRKKIAINRFQDKGGTFLLAMDNHKNPSGKILPAPSRLSFFLLFILLPSFILISPFVLNGPQSSVAFAAQVTLSWDASSSTGVSGYRVFYGTASLNYPNYTDIGTQTSYTLANLNAGTTYYLAVSAKNSSGQISNYSNEVVYTTASSTPSGGGSTGSGGSISGQTAQPASAVNLSSVGTTDWAHWGLATASSFNRKSGVTQQISNYALLGSTAPYRMTDSVAAFSWSGGTSTASASGSATGIYFTGAGNGYRLTVPAGTTEKTLQIYLGLWRARGKLEAKLSDGSATSYVTYLDNSSDVLERVVTLKFRAPSSSANLIIEYTLENNYGNSLGNIYLIAATLVGGTTTASQYSLTANVVGSGSVAKNPNQTQFNSGTTVQLTATPVSGWKFSGWSGNLVGNANPATLIMDSNKIVTATFTQNSSGGSSPQSSDLMGHWKFDEGTGLVASDASGYGNTGMLPGASWTASGKKNGALQLDGVYDRVQIPNSASLASASSQITVAAWVYLTDISNDWITVVERTDSGGQFLDFLMLARAAGGQPFFLVDWNQNNDIDEDEVVWGDIVLATNRWYFLTATYDGSAMRFYIDGTLRGTQAKSGGTITNSGREIWIGGNDYWGEFLKGRIDEVRIYNRALTAAEIQTLYAQ